MILIIEKNDISQVIEYMNNDCDCALEVLRTKHEILNDKRIAFKAANMEVNLDEIKKYCGDEYGNDLDVCLEVIRVNECYGLECLLDNYNQMSDDIKNNNLIIDRIKELFPQYSIDDLSLLEKFKKVANRGWCEADDYFVKIDDVVYTYNLRDGGGDEFIEITSWEWDNYLEEEYLLFLDMDIDQKYNLIQHISKL